MREWRRGDATSVRFSLQVPWQPAGAFRLDNIVTPLVRVSFV